jgi:hypothetical protein
MKLYEVVLAERNESAQRKNQMREAQRALVALEREANIALATKVSLHEHKILFPATFEALAKQGDCMYWIQDPDERRYDDLGVRKEPFDALLNPDAEPFELGDQEFLDQSEREAVEAERERCRAQSQDPVFISAVRINTSLLMAAYQGLVDRHCSAGDRRNA